MMRDTITGRTELLALMAYPIRHSSSPRMHNEALSYLGLDYAYLCFEVDQSNLKDAINSMRALKVRGGNVSMPNKIAVMQYLDKLSPEAELCGAVNTIVNDDGVLTGHITDGMGYILALKDRGYDIAGKKMTIIGAGGAAKAIQIQAALSGVAEVTIFNGQDDYWDRARHTVEVLNDELGCKATLCHLEDKERLRKEIFESDLLANATSAGMTPNTDAACIPDESYIKPGMMVTDVIYAPPKTKFLQMAEAVGCPTMNGFSMMLFQGAAAFKLWTGKDMPIEHMKEFLHI